MYDQWFPMALVALNVFEAVAELPVGGKDAERELFYRLQTGELPAWGIPKGGEVYKEIPPVMWLELRKHHGTWGTDDVGTSDDLIELTGNRGHHTHTYSMRPFQTSSVSKVRVGRSIVLQIWKSTSSETNVESAQPEVDKSRAAIIGSAKPGRKADFDWEDARSFTFKLLDEKGDYLINNDRVEGWKCQADLERAVTKHLSTLRSRDRREEVDGPRKSTVRPHVKRFAQEWRDQNGRQ